jgi:hypothetical protein
MKTNWPAVVKEYRKILVENVKFFKVIDDFGTIDKSFTEYFRMTVHQTDNFHPWNSDGELSRALARMPIRCNYRSIKSYWAFKNGKENIANAIYEMLTEAEDIINDHFSDSWNFPPGYVAPDEIEFPDWGYLITDRMVARLIRAAKMP